MTFFTWSFPCSSPKMPFAIHSGIGALQLVVEELLHPHGNVLLVRAAPRL